MAKQTEVRQRYQAALDELVQKLKGDRYVVAVILCGSLSHDEVWEKSDIDLLVITSEESKGASGYCLVEDSINIHTILYSRNKFKANIQSAVQSSFFHSFFSKSTLLFSHDETIEDLYHNVQHLGARDREIQLLGAVAWVLAGLYKAEKWFHVKKDMNYTFFWIMKMVDGLANLEVLQNGEIAGREVVQQALRHNSPFFNEIYTDLISAPKTEKRLGAALQAINCYLDERPFIFQPVLDFLAEARGPRSATEVNHYFKNQMNIGSADLVCEWLADKDIIQKVSTPLRLTPRSNATVEEAAYYYEGA